jgi:hypothetical protein
MDFYKNLFDGYGSQDNTFFYRLSSDTSFSLYKNLLFANIGVKGACSLVGVWGQSPQIWKKRGYGSRGYGSKAPRFGRRGGMGAKKAYHQIGG